MKKIVLEEFKNNAIKVLSATKGDKFFIFEDKDDHEKNFIALVKPQQRSSYNLIAKVYKRYNADGSYVIKYKEYNQDLIED